MSSVGLIDQAVAPRPGARGRRAVWVLLPGLLAGALVLGKLTMAPGLASPVQYRRLPTPDLTVPTASKPEVRWIPSPNFDARPVGVGVNTLVIHDTETPGIARAATIAKFFGNPRERASAHYVIGKQGEIVQCVADDMRAWHAGPSRFLGRTHVNDFAIGIELVNAQTGHDPFTDAQYRSLIALSAFLVEKYHIPVDRITGHRDVTLYPSARQDPADNFDWDRYLHGLQARVGGRGRVAAPTRVRAQFARI